MTDDEINETIARSLGWTGSGEKWVDPTGKKHEVWGDGSGLACPDGVNDLNVMYEAEKHAPIEYWVKLAQLCGLNSTRAYEDINNTFWPSIQGKMIGKIAGATARQRAEAYLRTLNLWK